MMAINGSPPLIADEIMKDDDQMSSCSNSSGTRWIQPLSDKDMDVIRSLDSRSFGFLDLGVKDSSSHNSSRSHHMSTSSASDFVSRQFISKGILMLRSQLQDSTETIKPSLYCQIGHLHLLLEQYPEALSAYQNYSSVSSDSCSNTSFLYGVGLVYFVYGKYDWSLAAFFKVLSLSPDFARLSEVHIRMAMMYKDLGELKKSMEHFSQAYTSAGPCSMSKLEIQFHIGHLYYMRGESGHAKHCFESILASKNVPNPIKALALRQLGWLYHTIPQLAGRGENSHLKAVELLKLAVGANHTCGQAWYFLGRCHADKGHFKEAFMAYRQSIDKMEKQPDTWCAIGILYQQMGQARDSLQAYITAIYFDITHTATWTDLGLLYESCGHLIDGLLCYKNGLATLDRKEPKLSPRKEGGDSVIEMLMSRLNFVESHIQQTGGIAGHNSQPRAVLPSLQEAWTSLVPQHFKLNYPNKETPIFTLPLTSYTPVPAPSPLLSPGLSVMSASSSNTQQPFVRKCRTPKSKEPIILRSINEGWSQQTTPFNHTYYNKPDTTEYTTYLNEPSLIAQPLTTPIAQSLTAPIAPPPQPHHFQPQSNPILYYNTDDSPVTHPSLIQDNNMYNSYPNNYTVDHRTTGIPLRSHNTVMDPHSHTTINPHTHTSTTMEPNSHTILDPRSHTTPMNPHSHTTPVDPHTYTTTTTTTNESSVDISSLIPSSPDPSLTDYLDKYITNDHTHSILPFPLDDSLDQLCQTPPTSVTGKRNSTQELNLHVKIPRITTPSNPPTQINDPTTRPTSLTILQTDTHTSKTHSYTTSSAKRGSGHSSDTSSGFSSSSTKFSTSSSNHTSPSSSPCLVSSPFSYPPTVSLSKERIVPVYEPHAGLGSSEEYMKDGPLLPPSPPPTSPSLELHPSVPVFEVNSYHEVELHTFCTSPEVPICIIRGLPEATDFDTTLFSTDTLVKYHGDHEVEVREQMLQAVDKNYDLTGKKQVWKCESSRSSTTVQEYGEYQKEVLKDNSKPKYDSCPRKMLKFGTNCDLSDYSKWTQQLEEIKKLPKFMQVNCPEANLLNHVGHTVLGMNTVQLYMKVPGCRTPGHQENNNFCSVNINIGPGDCEWFGVANKYWGVMHELCEKHKLSFLVGSWWPILEELEKLKVPVYQFTQYKGEVVWINPGTVHWVQANSVCNNIAWNVGPLSAHQLRMSWERYQWNKILKVRSIVPMMSLTWNVARNVKVTDPNMFQQISTLLKSSYRQCEHLIDLLTSSNVTITWHGHIEGEPTPTCTSCLEEVFNILFVCTNKKGEHLVYCHKCVQYLQSKYKKQTFTVLQQYALSDLKKVLNDFHLIRPSSS